MNEVQQQSTVLASSTTIINSNNSCSNTSSTSNINSTKCKSSCSSTCSSSCSSVVSSSGPWGTWEDLLLASAVLKHGTGNWNSVARELQCRALIVSPTLFSPEACKCRFGILNGRFSSCGDTISRGGSIPWIEEVRKLRIAQLKRELEQFDDSIGLLQKKLKRLKSDDAEISGSKYQTDHDKIAKQSTFSSGKSEYGLENCIKNDGHLIQELQGTALEGSLSVEAESVKTSEAESSSEIQCSIKEESATTKEFSVCEEDRKFIASISPKEDDGLQTENRNEKTDLRDESLQIENQNEANDLRDESQQKKILNETTDLGDESEQRKNQNETSDLSDEPQQRKNQDEAAYIGDEPQTPTEFHKSMYSLKTFVSTEKVECINTVSNGFKLDVKTEEKQNEEENAHIGNVVSVNIHSANGSSVQEGTCSNKNTASFEDSLCEANAMDLLRMAYEDAPESDCLSPEHVSGTVNSTSDTPIIEAEKNLSFEVCTPSAERPCVISVGGAEAKSEVVGVSRSPRSSISYEHQNPDTLETTGSLLQGSYSNVDAVGRKLQPCVNCSSDDSNNLLEYAMSTQTSNKRIKVDNKRVEDTFYESIPGENCHDSNKLGREDLVAKNEDLNLCEDLENKESSTAMISEISEPVRSVDSFKEGDLDLPPESFDKVINQMHMEQAGTDSVIKDNDEEHPSDDKDEQQQLNKFDKTERCKDNISEISATLGDTVSSALQRSSVCMEDEVKADDSMSDEDELLVDMMKLKGTDLLTLRRRKMPTRSDSNVEDVLLTKEKDIQSVDQKQQYKATCEQTSEPSSNAPLSNEGSSPKNTKIKFCRSEGLPTDAEQTLVSTHNDFLHDSFGGKGSTVEVFSTRRSRLKLRKPEPTCEETSKSQNADDTAANGIVTVASKIDQVMTEPAASEDSHVENYNLSNEPNRSITEGEMNTNKKFLPDLITLLECLRMISAHKFAPFFKLRPEIQGNSRYKNVVKRHMDLNAVRSKLEEGRYSASREFFRDMLLIFSNALVFYSKGSQEYDAARVLREFLVKEMERLLKDENCHRNDSTRKEVSYGDPNLDRETIASGSVMTLEKQQDVNDSETCLDTQSGTKEPQASITKNDDLGESPLVKETHTEGRKQAITTKNIRRGKFKSNTQHIEDNKVDKISEPKDFYKNQKDKYSESLNDNHLRSHSKKDTFTSQGTKRIAQTPPKATKDHIVKKERTDKNRTSKYGSGRQSSTLKEETKRTSGSSRLSRSSQTSKHSSRSNQPQRQNRSWL